MDRLRLGINIDHVATLRNARGRGHPDPLRAAQLVKQAGADGITVHLREDRRHIRDEDVFHIKEEVDLPLNLEMAATGEMVEIALNVKPNAVCIVPEKREELTTEGGLDVVKHLSHVKEITHTLQSQGIRVSLFIDPDKAQLGAAAECRADIVELHTGRYCDSAGDIQQQELNAISAAAALSASLDLECHAGHGLAYDNVKPIAAIPQIVELNIGHFLMGEAIFCGLEKAIHVMQQAMDEGRRAVAA